MSAGVLIVREVLQSGNHGKRALRIKALEDKLSELEESNSELKARACSR